MKREIAALGCAALWIGAMIGAAPIYAQKTGSMPKVQVTEQPKGKAFARPEDAAAALYAGARRNDEADLLVIFGPSAHDMLAWSNDPKELQEQRAWFAQKYDQMHRLQKEPDGTVALYIGAENWPLPIPLVEYKGAWYFDSELGRQEVMYRRIGQNEVEALEVCKALVDAEKEYYGSAHQYTEKFVSSSGSHDGLYWSGGDAGRSSPIGPHLARAGASATSDRTPFYGYYYRVLLDKQSGGFRVVAFPAAYRSSGVMTFLVDDKGKAYKKDLGDSTASVAGTLNAGNFDSSWKTAE